jgi:hypothetical protein
MLLPVQYAWFEPVLIATIVVFIIDLVGNSIGFGNRFLSALMSALVFGTLVYCVRNPCLFWLRQRVDVSDDDAEYNSPCSNAKVGRPNRRFSWSRLARAICEMGHNLHDYDVRSVVLTVRRSFPVFPYDRHRLHRSACLKSANFCLPHALRATLLRR